MASGLQRVRLTAPAGGIDVDSAPSQEKGDRALKLQNYLTGEPGRVRQRGPLTLAASAYGISNRRMISATPGNDNLLIGFRKDDASRIVDPWVAPRRNASSGSLSGAYEANPGARLIDLKANSPSAIDTTAHRSIIPSWAWTRMGNFVYAVAFDSDNDTDAGLTATIAYNDRGGRQRLTRLLRWDIRTPSTLPVAYTYGPYGMQDVRLHYNRLFVLGSRHPDTAGLYINVNRIWYTRALSASHHDYGYSPTDRFAAGVPDDTGSFNGGTDNPAFGAPSAAWGEASTPGVYNYIDLPWEEDFGVCFASIGRNLGIFKRKYLLLLQGFDQDTFELRTALTGTGALDPRSVVEANEGAYFLSEQGFQFFDGVRAHDASGGMKRLILDAGLAAVGDEGADGGFAIAERLARDFIMLTIGLAPGGATPATPTVTFCGLYHIPSNSWSTFTSETMATTGKAPMWVAKSENRVAIFDHADARVATKITTPEQATEAQRGVDENGTPDKTIETLWHSKVVELASPFEKVQHHRIIVDYEWIVDEGTADPLTTFNPTTTVTTRPKVELRDGGGALLQTFYLPQDGNSGTEARESLRQRFVFDYFSEANEVQVRVEYAAGNSPTSLVACSIHDVWIEYQVAAQRKNA